MSDRHRYVWPQCRVALRLRDVDFPFQCQCGYRLEQWADFDVHLCHGVEELQSGIGPGTQLEILLAQLDIHEQAGCDCQTIKREMDRLGAYGCRGRKRQLLKKLETNAQQYNWWDKIKAGGKLLSTGMIFKSGVTLGGLFDEACRLSEEAHPISEEGGIGSTPTPWSAHEARPGQTNQRCRP